MYTDTRNAGAVADASTMLSLTEPSAALANEPMAMLSAEIARLHVDNDDLRASADLWARLYEAALQRAIELQTRLDAFRNDLSPRER